MKPFLCFFVMLCLTFSAQAKITAAVNRSVATEGQSIELKVVSDSRKDGAPNFNILSDAFVLGGQSTLQNTSIINGKMQTTYTAGINLIPLKTGDITIPALTWGGEKTEPITVIVNPASTQANDIDLFIRSEMTPKTVYEGQEVIYTVSIFDRSGLTDGDFTPPVLKDAEIQDIRDLPLSTVQENGKTYHKFSRQYVIFPAKPGTFTVEPASFRGHVYQERTGVSSDVFSSFGFEPGFIYADLASQRKEVYVRSEPMVLTVKERPAFMAGKWWLPSTHVVMEETLTPTTDEIKAGDAVTRTIVVRARGVLGTKIPDLTMTDTPFFKVYPGQSKKENYVDEKGLIGIMEQSFVLVPVQNGTATVPPLTMTWFDVTNGMEKTASVPGKTFQIFGAAVSAVQEPPYQQAEHIQSAPLLPPERPLYAKENNWLFFIAGLSIGFIGAVLLFFAAMMRPGRRRKKKAPLADLYPDYLNK